MIDPKRVAPSNPFILGLKNRCILFPFGLLYRLWVRTIRFQFVDPSDRGDIERNEHPVIITLWHNRLFLAGEWQRRYRKDRKCFGLISASRDGAWLEAFYGWSGIYSVRGSSNRGGSKAIRDLVKKLRGGHDIGITPDGSRGPCYTAKPGGILVAKLAKAPMLLVTFEYGGCFRFKSWDRFVIPFPFSTVRVRTQSLSANDLLENSSIEDAAGTLTDALSELTFD